MQDVEFTAENKNYGYYKLDQAKELQNQQLKSL